MYYKEDLDSLNSLIKVIIKLNNKLYKLLMESYYSNFNSKAGTCLKYANNCNKKLKTNK